MNVINSYTRVGIYSLKIDNVVFKEFCLSNILNILEIFKINILFVLMDVDELDFDYYSVLFNF